MENVQGRPYMMVGTSVPLRLFSRKACSHGKMYTGAMVGAWMSITSEVLSELQNKNSISCMR